MSMVGQSLVPSSSNSHRYNKNGSSSPSTIKPCCNLHHLLINPAERFASIPSFFQTLPLPQPPNLPPPVPHPNPQRKIRPTYALQISYSGPHFPGGYEFNPNIDVPTVRGIATARLRCALGHKVSLATAGRTDANVSARAALFTFATPPRNGYQIANNGGGGSLPHDFIDRFNNLNVHGEITLHHVTPVHSSFHASFGTTAREYLYIVPICHKDLSFLPTSTTSFDRDCINNHNHHDGGNVNSNDIHDNKLYSPEQRQQSSMINPTYYYSNSNIPPSSYSEDDFSNTMCLHRMAHAANIMLQNVMNEEMNYKGMSHGKLTTMTSTCTMKDGGCWFYNEDGYCPNRDDDAVSDFGNCWKRHIREQKQMIHGNEIDSTAQYNQCLVFRFKADRFLRRMVRKSVNSLLQEASEVVSRNMRMEWNDRDDNDDDRNMNHDNDKDTKNQTWEQRWKQRIMEKDRSGNDPAPGEGLCLWRVEVQQ